MNAQRGCFLIFHNHINILREFFALAFLLLAMSAVSPPHVMAAEEVDLELLLAVDVSASIDTFEARQQRNGYLAALADPRVIDQIRQGPLGRIALAYMEWAGETYQRKVVDWQIVEDQASAEAFLERLAPAPLVSVPATSISGLIDVARWEFATNHFTGQRRVIDISADGPNSHGRRVSRARDDAVAEGIVIDALVIENTRSNPMGGAPAAGLEGYFSRRVIGGAGAFVMAAHFDNFAPMLVRKLPREIGADPVLLSQGGGQAWPEGRSGRWRSGFSSPAFRSQPAAGARARDAGCRDRCR
jgi:hypothetical protein